MKWSERLYNLGIMGFILGAAISIIPDYKVGLIFISSVCIFYSMKPIALGIHPYRWGNIFSMK